MYDYSCLDKKVRILCFGLWINIRYFLIKVFNFRNEKRFRFKVDDNIETVINMKYWLEFGKICYWRVFEIEIEWKSEYLFINIDNSIFLVRGNILG